MIVYVLVNNGYANLEYYDVCSNVSGVFRSKEKALESLKNDVKDYFDVVFNEENDFYELQDKDTKEIDEYSSWYTIEEYELD